MPHKWDLAPFCCIARRMTRAASSVDEAFVLTAKAITVSTRNLKIAST